MYQLAIQRVPLASQHQQQALQLLLLRFYDQQYFVSKHACTEPVLVTIVIVACSPKSASNQKEHKHV
jgi:hypothetical protein